MKRLLILLGLTMLVIMYGCKDDDSPVPIPPENSLSRYIVDSNLPVVTQQLVACAGGGQEDYLTDPANTISIFFYPEGSAHSFRYFETEISGIDTSNFDLYQEQILDDLPVFNGYLKRFVRPVTSQSKWCVVTFIRNGNLHISDPIKLKLPDLPTEFNPDLLQIDLSDGLSPKFLWADGRLPGSIIYFHVITNAVGDLISGTYTIEKQFQFYDLSNVVLNIRDINPPPALLPNETYTFTLMGISDDNWVNLISEKDFMTR